MIKLRNVDKYFNKGKDNEIHVIDNTSLELPEKGLVTLLGESGSGKTTLLNVIGGLDKASGSITFNDYELEKYQSNKWAEIRNKHIGYVFQNYYLLENKTVYENIKIVLEMIGINDQELIEERIKYVLEAVSMYRFRNRGAGNLSGGQKQRVAIARALVKNPDVIIADEPTGNLDTNNSIEVMKIIKEISKDKLVVLVTHNNNLAKNYSDRIINIKDGKVINDQDNISGEVTLDYIDHNIYLKDLNSTKVDNINIYSNEDITDLELTIVKIDNNYFIKSNDKNVTFKNLEKDKSITLINEHKKNVKETFTKETTFDAKELELPISDLKSKSVYSFKDSFIEALKKVTNLGKKAKFQIFALIALGMMFTVGSFMLYSAVTIDTSKINIDKELYSMDLSVATEQDLELLLEDDFIFYSSYDTSRAYFNKGSFTQYTEITIVPSELINKDVSYEEAIIDKNVLSQKNDWSYTLKNFGITEEKHLLNQRFLTSNDSTFKVSELTNTNTYNLYVNSDVLMLANYRLHSKTQESENMRFYESDDIQLSSKQYISNPEISNYEFGIYLSDSLPVEILDEYAKYYKIKGLYIDNGTNNAYVMKKDFKKASLLEFRQIYMVAKNGRANEIQNKESLYDIRYNQMKNDQKDMLTSSLTQTLFALTVTIVIFFFLVRSSLTERIKEISVLRSLGLNKSNIIRLYATEYAILTTFTSLIGLIIGAFITKSISDSIFGTFINIRVDILSFSIVFVLIYFFNIITGLIPVLLKLRQTPAEMLTSYDM